MDLSNCKKLLDILKTVQFLVFVKQQPSFNIEWTFRNRKLKRKFLGPYYVFIFVVFPLFIDGLVLMLINPSSPLIAHPSYWETWHPCPECEEVCWCWCWCANQGIIKNRFLSTNSVIPDDRKRFHWKFILFVSHSVSPMSPSNNKSARCTGNIQISTIRHLTCENENLTMCWDEQY